MAARLRLHSRRDRKSMLKLMAADLHVHTVLSACAEVEMVPQLIVDRAVRLGLNLIAITDHNACANAWAVREAAEGSGITVLPGMELQTREEIHVLCIFDEIDACNEWQEEVFRNLPQLLNRPEIFGEQWVVNARGDWLRTEQRLLATSTALTLEAAVQGVHRRGGVVIPSHVDRPSFSLLANLGIIPEDLEADALEITPYFVPGTGNDQWPQLAAWPLIVNGDAHRLSEMRDNTLFKIASPDAKEIAMAFRRQDGREVTIRWSQKHPE